MSGDLKNGTCGPDSERVSGISPARLLARKTFPGVIAALAKEFLYSQQSK